MPYEFDPELAVALPQLAMAEGDTDADLVTRRLRIRRILASRPVPDTTGLHIEDRMVPGAHGDPEVRLRIYRPDNTIAPAAVYVLHGGGFMFGDLETEHAGSVEMAQTLGIVVVSVDYRLAPETRYPGALNDVYAGFEWLSQNAGDLGVDPARIAIAGGSAGGGLCAALALLARDRGGPHIAFQFLSVPELDDRLDTASMVDFTDTPVWNRAGAIQSWEAYLGPGRPGSEDVDHYAAPARATDLRCLPPAYVAVMQFDPLRDEGITYALSMLAAGVTTELHLFPGTFHGSALIAHASVSRREREERLYVLRHALQV